MTLLLKVPGSSRGSDLADVGKYSGRADRDYVTYDVVVCVRLVSLVQK